MGLRLCLFCQYFRIKPLQVERSWASCEKKQFNDVRLYTYSNPLHPIFLRAHKCPLFDLADEFYDMVETAEARPDLSFTTPDLPSPYDGA